MRGGLFCFAQTQNRKANTHAIMAFWIAPFVSVVVSSIMMDKVVRFVEF